MAYLNKESIHNCSEIILLALDEVLFGLEDPDSVVRGPN